MYQRVQKPGRYFAHLWLLIISLLCSLDIAVAQSIDAKPEEPATSEASALDVEITATPPRPRILVLLGLKEQANQLVEIAVADELGDMDVLQVETSEAASPDYRWPEVDIVVSAGRAGCQLALQAVRDNRILCTLLTEEGFHSLTPVIVKQTLLRFPHW